MHRSVFLRAEAELDPVKSAGDIYQIACAILRRERLGDCPFAFSCWVAPASRPRARR